MKKTLAVILVLAFGLFACASAESYTFHMGIDPEYPPYTYLGDDGEYTGYDVEMARAVCGILGWELEIVPINWDTKLFNLDSGEIDCIWSGLTIDVISPDEYTLSIPYSDNSQMILTKAAYGIATMDDLAGKVVGVQLGTSADIALSEGGGAEALGATFGELRRFENYNVCFTELMADAIDAVAIDIGVAAGKIAEYGDEYVMLDESFAAEKYGICFRKDDAEICKQVEEALMQLVADGTYVSLAEKYGLDVEALCLKAE